MTDICMMKMRSNKKASRAGNIQDASRGNDILAPLYRKFGNRFLKYRDLWEKTAECRVKTPFPLFLVFELTDRCNYACAMCFRGNAALRKEYAYQGRIELKTFKRLIDEASEYNCPSISLNNNNEPLLQKNLEDYIKYASRKGVLDIMINTNASLLTKARARSLIDSGLTRIMFSIDATTPRTYKRMRGRDNLPEIRQNILNFVDLKRKLGREIPLVRITFVRTSFNVKEEEEFVEFWKDKCDYISFQEFLPPKPSGYGYLKPKSHITRGNFRCNSPWQRLIIQGDGSVLPCCQHYARDMIIGSINRQTLKRIWDSEKMQWLRKITRTNRLAHNSVCYRCKLSYDNQEKMELKS